MCCNNYWDGIEFSRICAVSVTLLEVKLFLALVRGTLSSSSLVRSPDTFTAHENYVKERSLTWSSTKTCGAAEFTPSLSIWSPASNRRNTDNWSQSFHTYMWSFLLVQISPGHGYCVGHGESVMGHTLRCFSSWTAYEGSNHIDSRSNCVFRHGQLLSEG